MAHLIRQSPREGHTGSLWQGGMIDTGHQGYDVIVLCAEEFQPESNIPNVQVVYAPNNDDGSPLTRPQLSIAISAARVVAKAYRQGKKVLVSCMQGRNRSGLVMALALHLLYGLSGESCRSYIRARVPHALTNDSFTAFLNGVPAKVRA